MQVGVEENAGANSSRCFVSENGSSQHIAGSCYKLNPERCIGAIHARENRGDDISGHCFLPPSNQSSRS